MNWKSPPVGDKVWINKSMELQVMLLCNWSCQACDQFSQFPQISWVRQATMREEQIHHFIGEMRDRNGYIGRIRIVGGEPTLHPKFATIVTDLYNSLVVPGYIGRLEVVTNGSHPEKIKPVKEMIEKVRVSDEKDKQRSHVANLQATPAQLGYEGKMCNAPWHCGFSLNYYGYFPCSSGAGIARLTGDMQRWQRLALPFPSAAGRSMAMTVHDMWPDLQQLCNGCYHALRPEDKIRCGTGQQPDQFKLNTPSPETWNHLGPWLAGQKQQWAVYGASA